MLAGIGIIIVAVIILRRHTENVTLAMVIRGLQDTPNDKILIALLSTLVGFAAMAVNEIIAVKALPNKNLPWRVPFIAGAAGNSLANTLGFPAFTISAWRYRVYSAVGLNVLDISRITAVAFMGVVLGFLGITALSLILDLHIMGGLLLVFIITGFLVWINGQPKRVGLKSWAIMLPRARLGILQLFVGIIDMSAAIFTAYILLPLDIAPAFAHFALFYIVSALFGIASHAPGGIGVFEAGMMTALAANGRADVLAALLLYRVIYNLIPFCFACITVAAHTLRRS